MQQVTRNPQRDQWTHLLRAQYENEAEYLDLSKKPPSFGTPYQLLSILTYDRFSV
ncbi:Hypothetical protein Cp4202_0395 [Corynebacterium pseudotuberculosis 42/02-A]|nr:Hypothetical protein Cp4202_0395 [Corynebacterium pseudotuberculosis 42/02-A]